MKWKIIIPITMIDSGPAKLLDKSKGITDDYYIHICKNFSQRILNIPINIIDLWIVIKYTRNIKV